MMAVGRLLFGAERETDGWTSAVAALLAALSLGRAVQINNGHFRPEAIAMLTLACALALVAVASPRFSAIERHGPRIALGILAVGVTYEIVELVSRSPGMYLQLARSRELLPFFGGATVCGALAVAALLGERWKRICVPLLLLGHFLLGVWMIHASPDPRIDVYVFQRDASAALLSGHDPYGMSHPYLGPDPRFYGPGMLVDGRLHIGFPYPPLSAFLCLPGHLFGDYRYSHLAAMTLAGGIMAFLRPGPLATGAAALFLFTPRGFFVLEQGWTEPLVVLALVATVACAARFRRALPYALGLFFAVKQYSVLAGQSSPSQSVNRRAAVLALGVRIGIEQQVSTRSLLPMLRELELAHMKTRASGWQDFEAHALALGLRSCGELERGLRVLVEYTTQFRREPWAIPDYLSDLMQELRDSYAVSATRKMEPLSGVR